MAVQRILAAVYHALISLEWSGLARRFSIFPTIFHGGENLDIATGGRYFA